MTEPEWLSSTTPTPMLEFLKGKASDRKLRLFAVACCRRIVDQMPDDICKTAVDVAEGYADGRCSLNELDAISQELGASKGKYMIIGESLEYAADAAEFASSKENFCRTCEWAAVAKGIKVSYEAWQQERDIEQGCQAHLLRCIFNPFALSLDASWQTPTVLALAQGIYTERAFDRLPILADALSDAGCSNEDLLKHLRSETVHTRGCWALDLCLNRE